MGLSIIYLQTISIHWKKFVKALLNYNVLLISYLLQYWNSVNQLLFLSSFRKLQDFCITYSPEYANSQRLF